PRERQELGKAALVAPTILLQGTKDKSGWQRLRPESRVSSADYLLSLPGYHSDLRLDRGVQLELWGNLPQFSQIPVLESGVFLINNPSVDLDFTLDHGRVVLKNVKNEGPARVRVHFLSEAWDLTLADQNSEAALELVGFCQPYSRDAAAGEPNLLARLYALKGTMTV